MSPTAALARYHFRLVWGWIVPALIAICGLVILTAPPSWLLSVVIGSYLAAVFAPFSSLIAPSTLERCLPMSLAALRQARFRVHLGIAACGLLPLAAFWMRMADRDASLTPSALAILALGIPLWPCVAMIIGPLVWRSRMTRGFIAALAVCACVATGVGLIIASDTHTAAVPLALAMSLAALGGALLVAPAGAQHELPRYVAVGFTDRPAEAGPMPSWLVRCWRAVAAPVSSLPPVPRALVLGIWARPWFLYIFVLMPLWAGSCVAGGSAGGFMGAMMMLIGAFQIHRLGLASVGGLIGRRLTLTAIYLPPLLIFTIAYGICASTGVGAWLPFRDRLMKDSLEREPTAMWYYLADAFPGRHEVLMPDGLRLSLERWGDHYGRSAAANASPPFLARQLARIVEREHSTRIDPALLETADGASTAPAMPLIATALERRNGLLGLAIVVAYALMICTQIPGRRAQRRNTGAIWKSRNGILSIAIIAVSALSLCLSMLEPGAIPMPADGSLPEAPLPWWDIVIADLVMHAGWSACALAAIAAACAITAWKRALWLPLGPSASRSAF